MSSVDDAKLSLKVMMNKQKSKVLFAEANKDFVDVLLSFLTLPLGKVITILRKHCGETAQEIGSLNTLYTGLSNLDVSYFSVRGAKAMLLNPESSCRAECCKLAIDISSSLRKNRYYICGDLGCTKQGCRNISLYSDIATCDCGRSLNRRYPVLEGLDNAGGFTINSSSFIITDDLCVVPLDGIIQTLSNHLANTDTQVVEMVDVSFGINEIRDLLECSFTSATPLTDVVIKMNHIRSTAAKPPEMFFHDIQKHYANSRKIDLKVCLQKSTNKFLFAVATDEFVELIFSFLTVPVGGVEFLLGGNAGLKGIDNLYKSVSKCIDDKYFTTPDTKNRLINPKLPHGYISKYQFLPLSEEAPPKLYMWMRWSIVDQRWCDCSFHEKELLVSSFKSSKETYVKKQTMYIVTDDLNVSCSLATSISILNALGIPLSDVKEMELHIGLEEALGILKASLTSKTALTDALIKPMLKTLPK